MKYPNAYAGIKKIFVSQILEIISVIFFLIGMIAVIAGAVSLTGETEVAAAGLVTAGVGVILAIAGSIIAIIALILNLIGLNKAKNDEKNFQYAFWFVIIGLAATIITTLLICDIVEPYVIFHHVFKDSPRKFYVRSYSYVALFIVCLFAMSFLMRPCDNQILELFLNGFISVGISVVALSVLSMLDKKFRHELLGWINTAKGWLMRHR